MWIGNTYQDKLYKLYILINLEILVENLKKRKICDKNEFSVFKLTKQRIKLRYIYIYWK